MMLADVTMAEKKVLQNESAEALGGFWQ